MIRHTQDSTRLSAAWALAEAGATTSEIAAAEVADLDLADGRVWLRGCSRREPRWGRLTEWGVAAAAARVADMDVAFTASVPLVYGSQGSAKSAQAASCDAIAEVLIRAELARQPGVLPGSVAAWAGVQVWRDTERIEAVARALGLRTLDAAARTIGLDWRKATGGST